jgi:hypothetical protein
MSCWHDQLIGRERVSKNNFSIKTLIYFKTAIFLHVLSHGNNLDGLGDFLLCDLYVVIYF